MKKVLFILVALAVAGFALPAMAKDGLSVELGFAYNPNGADMGKTIVKDGEGGQENGLFGDVIMPENALLSLKNYNVQHPSLGNLGSPISSVSDDGQMTGLNTALRVRYNFLNAFFARIGFVYDMQIGGGSDSFKITSNSLVVNSLATSQGASNWTNTALLGAKVTQEWTYGYWAIPVTIGINIPISDGKYNIYAGIGLTYYSGFWQLEMSIPQGYIIDDYDGNGTINTTDTGLATAAKEKVKFEASGIGINWTVGISAEVYQDVSIFIELDATIAGGMSDSVKLSSNQAKAAFGVDNMHYPVNLSTQLLRFGASYRLPLNI